MHLRSQTTNEYTTTSVSKILSGVSLTVPLDTQYPPASLLLAVGVSVLSVSVEAFQRLQLQSIRLANGRRFRVRNDEGVVAVLPVQTVLVNCQLKNL